MAEETSPQLYTQKFEKTGNFSTWVQVELVLVPTNLAIAWVLQIYARFYQKDCSFYSVLFCFLEQLNARKTGVTEVRRCKMQRRKGTLHVFSRSCSVMARFFARDVVENSLKKPTTGWEVVLSTSLFQLKTLVWEKNSGVYPTIGCWQISRFGEWIINNLTVSLLLRS